jgi:uncharacterized protein (DUF2164 family)
MKLIDLTSEEKQRLITEIQAFFENERDEKIGVIAAETVLEFFLEVIGSKIYNTALMDVKAWFARGLENLDADYDMLYK